MKSISDMLDEYDFSKGVRGKYASRYAEYRGARNMERRRVEVRLTEAEHINDSEVTTVRFRYDCSWIVDGGALVVRYGDDDRIMATFAASKWQFVCRLDE